jgi:hypothetical protein
MEGRFSAESQGILNSVHHLVSKLASSSVVFLQKAKAFSTQYITWYLSLPVALSEEIVRFLSPSVCKFLEIVKSEIISPTGKF